tara:strand:+ start:43 stop:360 length:318 start_codon:yes stop_codon:yes gene_type:complete
MVWGVKTLYAVLLALVLGVGYCLLSADIHCKWLVMTKFIEVNEDLTGANDELRYVNIEHIVMVKPRQNNEGSLIYLDKDTGYETPEAYESLRGRLRDIIKGPISG